jgi:hypothetical protein
MGKFTGIFDDVEDDPNTTTVAKTSRFAGIFDDEPAEEERSIGGFLENAGSNAYDIGSGLASGVETLFNDPTGTISKIGDITEDDVKGFLRGTGRDLGFHFNPDKSVGWSKDQLATNLYERPIDVGLSASMFTPAGANPLRFAAKGAAKVGAVPAKTAKYAAGLTSGLGPRAIEEAYRSGRVGGTEGKAFREGMRGELDPDLPVDVARSAVDELKVDRAAEYKAGKAGWAASTKPLDFQPIEDAFNSVMGVKRFRGKDLNPHVAKARDEVRAVLDEWKADPGAWTAEGFDALKQRIQGIGQSLNPMTEGAARSVVGAVGAAIKKQISKQAPDYAKSMKAYERASQAITEVQKTLTGTSRVSHDTALRKLQSVLRNNALTNYSARAKLAELISKKAPELMPMLSGMAANTWTPRGLPGILLGGGSVGVAGFGAGKGALAAAAIDPMSATLLGGAIAAASPRVVGEIAHGAGRVRRGFDKAAPYSPAVAGLLSLNQYFGQ